MVSYYNIPRVGMSGGNLIAHIAAIAQLHQRARRLCLSGIPIRLPKLNIREANFASPIALGMPKTQHPTHFLSFHNILSNCAA